MTLAALDGTLNLTADTWTRMADSNCTFAVLSGIVEVRGTTGSAPSAGSRGIPYETGTGEGAEVDMLARFTGITATSLWVIAVGLPAVLFVSRVDVP